MILKASRFICSRTGIPQIPHLRPLSHVKRRGPESAATEGVRTASESRSDHQSRIMSWPLPLFGAKSSSGITLQE